MADTIHTSGGDSNGMGFFMGMILLVLLVLFFMFYGLPAMRGGSNTQQPAPSAPAVEGGDGGSIEVPDQIDINVNQPKN